MKKKGLTLRFVWFLPFFNIAFCLIVKNSGFGSKNLGFGDKDLGIDGEILGIARLKSEILDAKLNASVRDKILQLVNEIQINQVFGAGDIVDILKCAPATATNLIKRMKTLNIVEPVVGTGKGKYVLMCHSVERNDALLLYMVLPKQIILLTAAKCLCH